MKTNTIASVVAIALAATSITACSDKGSKTAKPETEAQIFAQVKKSLPHADLKVPDSAYQVASNSNADLYFARLAFEEPPINYDEIGKSIDYKYANTNDAFKKQEILQTLKPKIDQRITNAKNNRYYVITDNYLKFGHYDFDKKSFPIEKFISNAGPDSSHAFEPHISIYNNNDKAPYIGPDAHISVIVTNPEKFTALPVSDQDTARRMEEFINMNSYNNPYNVEIYTVIQGYPKNLSRKDYLYGEITKIRVVDYKGNLIGETSLQK